MTMVSDNSNESAMSVSTAMTGEVVSNGGKQPSIKKVKPKISIDDYEIGKVVGYSNVFLKNVQMVPDL